jgi:hypothetical protein
MKNKIFLYAIIVLLAFASCTKGPGVGGRASIVGKLWATNLSTNLSVISDSGYLAATKVYISYGDILGVGNNVETSYDGSFVFDYLRPGIYKIWTSSKVYLGITQLDTVVVKTITIDSKNQNVNMGDLRIFTNKN